jgi:hypothetical protein
MMLFDCLCVLREIKFYQYIFVWCTCAVQLIAASEAAFYYDSGVMITILGWA